MKECASPLIHWYSAAPLAASASSNTATRAKPRPTSVRQARARCGATREAAATKAPYSGSSKASFSPVKAIRSLARAKWWGAAGLHARLTSAQASRASRISPPGDQSRRPAATGRQAAPASATAGAKPRLPT